MSEEVVKVRRGRGKGKRPAMSHVNLRVPTEVMDHFRQYPNYTKKIREVLTAYVHHNRPDDSDPRPPDHDLTMLGGENELDKVKDCDNLNAAGEPHGNDARG